VVIWVVRLAFLMPYFTNLAFFRGSWRQKKLFGFVFNIRLFWRQFAHTIRLVSWVFKYLAEKRY